MPLTGEIAKGRRVLLLSAEDNWQRQTLPRLLKNGANLDNIHQMYKVRALDDEVFDQLAAEIEEWRPDLIVIDTLSAYMGGARDMNRQNEVGEFLQKHTELAESVGCAILGLAHLNKQSGEDPLYRMSDRSASLHRYDQHCFWEWTLMSLKWSLWHMARLTVDL